MTLFNFLNTKSKAFVIFLFSLSSIAIFIISTFFATLVCKSFFGILIGLILMISAIPIHCQGKKHKSAYLLSFLINSLANGFSVSAYYILANIPLNLCDMLLSTIPPISVLLFTYLAIQILKKSKKAIVTISSIVNVILLITLIVLWIMYGQLIFSFGFFCSLISIFYLCVFGTAINHENRNVFRFISFGSFGLFIIITFIVVFILSEGEILEGADFSLSDDDKK